MFGWMNDQLLRMVWLNDLVAKASRRSGMIPPRVSAQFFVYDVIKIFIRLSVLIFAISWVQSHPIALAYVGVWLVVAIVGGTVIGRMRMEDQVADFVRTVPVSGEAETMTQRERLTYSCDQVVREAGRGVPRERV